MNTSIQNTQDSKDRLRKEKRAARRALTESEHLHTSKQIAQQLTKLDIFKQAKTIGVYLAMPEEIPLDAVIEQARADAKSLFLPEVEKKGELKQMRFQHWAENAELVTNHYGIQELATSNITTPKFDAHDSPSLDILLMPLVAYNHQGHRLGMGGGYYDRYLEHSNNNSSLLRVGIAHSCQFHENIPTEKWDQPLDLLINENTLLDFR